MSSFVIRAEFPNDPKQPWLYLLFLGGATTWTTLSDEAWQISDEADAAKVRDYVFHKILGGVPPDNWPAGQRYLLELCEILPSGLVVE